jgi:hypothetical protein
MIAVRSFIDMMRLLGRAAGFTLAWLVVWTVAALALKGAVNVFRTL